MLTQRGIDDLLTAAKNGDVEAENELFSKLRARISNLVQYRLWNSCHAEDIVQEIMVTILAKYRTTDLPKGLLPWVNGVTRNKVKNYIRTAKKAPTDLGEETPQDEREGPDAILTNEELEEVIARALRKLNEKQKGIMRALLEGDIKSYISEHRHKTPLGTLYADIHRCRNRFMELLKDEGYDI